MQRIFWIWMVFSCLVGVTGCGQKSKAEVKKVKVDDIEIAYYTRGSGKPLMMVMGYKGTMAVWDPALLEELEKHYTLILFDNRGAGFSSDSKEDLTTVPQMAKDTAKLIKALGYEKVNLLGWSMGSRIAQELALSQPEVIEKLILCSPNPGGKYQAPRQTDAYKSLTEINQPIEKALSVIFPDTEAGNKAKDLFVERLTLAITKKTVPYDLTMSVETVGRQTHALALWDENNDNYAALKTIKVPTLVCGGLSDSLDAPENVKIVAGQIPFAWSAYFEGAGHAFMSQDHARFALLVKSFLGE